MFFPLCYVFEDRKPRDKVSFLIIIYENTDSVKLSLEMLMVRLPDKKHINSKQFMYSWGKRANLM